MRRTATTALVATLLAGVFAVLLPAGTASAAGCKEPPAGGSAIVDKPWTQDTYDLPGTVWPHSTGAGVTVAVIGSGVEASNDQLAAATLPGADLTASGPADFDCLPSSTALAGIVAARRTPGIGFVGLAPSARILPIRITERVVADTDKDKVDNALLAEAIDYARTNGAQVVDVGVVSNRPDAAVEAAVQRAIAAGVVIVAGVGDNYDQDRDKGGPTDSQFTPYPAAYDGVIGVTAVGPDGQRPDTAQIGDYVDLAAPGKDVVSTSTVGQTTVEGTVYASAFVAGTVALMLGDPDAPYRTLPAAQRVAAVTRQLEATAGTAFGDTPGQAYGAGVVDPARALTEETTTAQPVAPGSRVTPEPDPAAVAVAEDRSERGSQAFTVVGIGLAAVAVLVVLALVVPRGRRRSWSTGRRRAVDRTGDDQPEFIPGEALFQAKVPE